VDGVTVIKPPKGARVETGAMEKMEETEALPKDENGVLLPVPCPCCVGTGVVYPNTMWWFNRNQGEMQMAAFEKKMEQARSNLTVPGPGIMKMPPPPGTPR
jgi:hypothetical protein